MSRGRGGGHEDVASQDQEGHTRMISWRRASNRLDATPFFPLITPDTSLIFYLSRLSAVSCKRPKETFPPPAPVSITALPFANLGTSTPPPRSPPKSPPSPHAAKSFSMDTRPRDSRSCISTLTGATPRWGRGRCGTRFTCWRGLST